MAASVLTTIFDHTNPAHRELKGWRTEGPHCWEVYARRYARQHGEAKVWRADDSVVRFWRDGDTVRQRTYRHVLHVRA